MCCLSFPARDIGDPAGRVPSSQGEDSFHESILSPFSPACHIHDPDFTKALYQLGYEQNRISVVQALVLMSLWYLTPDDQMDAHHWLQIAVSIAHRASLNRDPTFMNLSEDERRLRKRIWWCCLIRDPLLALGLKRSIIIMPEDHNVPGLTLDDFDVENANMSHAGLAKLGLEWNHAKVRLLRLTYISEAKLHQCLSQIISKQYALKDHHRGRVADPKATRAILLPLTTEGAWHSLATCEESLHAWRDTLPMELTSTTISLDSLDSDFDAFHMFRTVLHMVYHTCIITMYRPWYMYETDSSASSLLVAAKEPACQTKIRDAIRASARSITDFALELHKADLARHLPQTGLSAMVAAVVSHISDIASGDPTLREPALRAFEQCLHMMNELRENYYSADFTCDFVNLIARAKNLTNVVACRVPAQTALSYSFDLEEQTQAQKKFLAAHRTPAAVPTVPSETRIPPDTLFPQGIELNLNVASTPNLSDQTFEAPKAHLELEVPGPMPPGTDESWEYFRNFREESARLLGDFFDDCQFNQFNSLPGIDLTS